MAYEHVKNDNRQLSKELARRQIHIPTPVTECVKTKPTVWTYFSHNLQGEIAVSMRLLWVELPARTVTHEGGGGESGRVEVLMEVGDGSGM